MSSYGSMRSGMFSRPGFFGGFSMFPPVIKALIISNVIIWFLLDFLLPPFTLSGIPIFGILAEYLALWPFGTNFWPWQLVTYMFMHGGFLHLFFNMLMLWMFGMELENAWGSRKFLIFYLLCGVGGGLANILVGPLVGQGGPTVGASGAVFGVLLAFAMLFPDRPIYLYFLFPIRAKYLIAALIGFELLVGVTGSSEGVAHFAHLGGAAVGFVYMLAELGIIPLREWFITFKGEESHPFTHTTRVRKTGDEIHEAQFYDIHTGRPSERKQDVSQEVIDAILDKISTGGYQSLTEEEKRILNEASKRMH